MTSDSANPCTTSIIKHIYFKQSKYKTWVVQIFKTYFSAVRDNLSHQSNPPRPKGKDSTHILNSKARTKNRQ
jgi:hypothetical protein